MTEEVLHTDINHSQSRSRRVIEGLLHFFGVHEFISYAQVIHNFLFVLAIVGIGVLEIFNTHLAVRFNRNISKKQETIKLLRWEHIAIKADMNQKSKQSELQKILEPYGLKALQEPPKKISVSKNHFIQNNTNNKKD